MDKNKKILVAVMILIALLLSIYFAKNIVASNQFSDNNTYIIDAVYDKENRLLRGNQTVKYTNQTGIDLEELKFHLFQNAYMSLETAPNLLTEFEHYPDGFSEGKTAIRQIKVDGNPAEFKVDDQILTIHLENKLCINESSKIEIEFEDIIPHSNSRYGVFNDITSLAHWYPILAVHDGEEWKVRKYYNMGESNYSDIADYYVNITLPDDEVVVGTGEKLGEYNKKNGYKEVKFKALKVRDFTLITSNKYLKESKEVDGITIDSYFLPEHRAGGLRAIEYVENALVYYSKLIGKYPYRKINIVESNIENVGMEYSQVLSIGSKLYEGYENLGFEVTIVHEMGHQWFYGIVGNDQCNDPWLDESIVTYLTAKYFRDNGREEIFKLQVLNNEFGLGQYKSVFSPVTAFDSWNSYLNTIYKRGSVVIYKLNKDIGDDKFEQLLKNIYTEYKYKNIGTEEFLNILEKVVSKDAAKTFKDVALGENKVEISDIKKTMDFSELPPSQQKIAKMWHNMNNKIKELRDNGCNVNITLDYLFNIKGDVFIVYGTNGNETQNKDMKLTSDMISKTCMEESRFNCRTKLVTDRDALNIDEKPNTIIVVGNPDINKYYDVINEKLDIQIHGDEISILDFIYNIEGEKYFFNYVVDDYINKDKNILIFYSKDGTGLSRNYRGYYGSSTFGGGIGYNPDFKGLIVDKDGKKEVMIFDDEGNVMDK